MKNRLIVISRYNENLDWLKELKFPYIIYNKGENNINYPSIPTPNVGRESETFLRYIVENYPNFPDEIVFLQGNPFDHCNNILFLLNSNKNMNLTYQIKDKIVFLMNKHLEKYYLESDINGNPHHPGLPIKEILDQIGIEYNGSLLFSQGAQYLILKSCLLSKSLEWWKHIYHIHNNIPSSPWVFERIWPLIYESEEI
jgi:hypothetical protein